MCPLPRGSAASEPTYARGSVRASLPVTQEVIGDPAETFEPAATPGKRSRGSDRLRRLFFVESWLHGSLYHSTAMGSKDEVSADEHECRKEWCLSTWETPDLLVTHGHPRTDETDREEPQGCPLGHRVVALTDTQRDVVVEVWAFFEPEECREPIRISVPAHQLEQSLA
jgi:hypothetical protein